MAGLIWMIGNFEPKLETVTWYEERLQLFLAAGLFANMNVIRMGIYFQNIVQVSVKTYYEFLGIKVN